MCTDWLANLLPFSRQPAAYATLAAGVITYLGIMQALILTPGREKMFLRLYSVRTCLARLRTFELNRRERPDVLWAQNQTTAEKIYNEANIHWDKLEEELSKEPFGFKPFFFFVGLSAFALFLASAYEQLLPFQCRIWTFYGAVILLLLLMTLHVKALGMLSKPDPRRGEGKVLIHAIDGETYERGKDKIRYEVPEDSQEIKVRVSFRGKVTNGFFDSAVFLEDGSYFFYPDRVTYFNDFVVMEHDHKPRLVLTDMFDTGAIQGDWSREAIWLTFKFSVRTGGSYDRAKLRSNVSRIEIGVYEDPAYVLTREVRGGVPEQVEEVRLRVDFATVELEFLQE